MKKIKIHQFDSVIYPVKLWITITSNLLPIRERFVRYPSGKKFVITGTEGLLAFTDLVASKETKEIGILITIKSRNNLSIGLIAHEATHVSDKLWNHIGERNPGNEANAYLVEWIANCIWKVKTNKE